MAVITLCNHENCTVILSTSHTKRYDQTTNSSSTAHPHFWQLPTADGRQTFSIFVTLSEPEINTGRTKLPAIHNAQMTSSPPVFQLVTHPTIFWTSGNTVFLLWLSWALQMLQYCKRGTAFLCNTDATPQRKVEKNVSKTYCLSTS